MVGLRDDAHRRMLVGLGIAQHQYLLQQRPPRLRDLRFRVAAHRSLSLLAARSTTMRSPLSQPSFINASQHFTTDGAGSRVPFSMPRSVVVACSPVMPSTLHISLTVRARPMSCVPSSRRTRLKSAGFTSGSRCIRRPIASRQSITPNGRAATNLYRGETMSQVSNWLGCGVGVGCLTSNPCADTLPDIDMGQAPTHPRWPSMRLH